MAISQTMSNPAEWMYQSYQNNFSNINHTETPPPTITSSSVSRGVNNLGPDQGRVSKPVRRRSRASSRTPTTVLNTDATNFRAMVQHFTGAPTAPFAATSRLPNNGAATITTAAAPASGFHVQYQNQLQQQHMFMMDNMHRHGSGGAAAAAPESSANENPNYNNYML